MRVLIIVLLTLTLAACGDVVTSRYATLQDARADQLFERGWLPDLLPPSAHDIRTSNNLDLNTSSGEFSFSPADSKLLAARLSPYASPQCPFVNLDSEVKSHLGRGYPAYQYFEDHTTWVFLCRPERGECDYVMWLSR